MGSKIVKNILLGISFLALSVGVMLISWEIYEIFFDTNVSGGETYVKARLDLAFLEQVPLSLLLITLGYFKLNKNIHKLIGIFVIILINFLYMILRINIIGIY